MRENILRVGHFTSSEIFLLCQNGKGSATFSAAGLKYIRRKRAERRLGRSVEKDIYKQDMAWGDFMERVVFEVLGLEYNLSSKLTHKHHRHGEIWSGSTDLIVERKKIAEIKAFQLENFSYYTDCLLEKDIALFKKLFPKEYWQLISNGLINRVGTVEAISFAPYEEDMDEIREMVEQYCLSPAGAEDAWKYRFIVEKENKDLACIKKGGFYESVNRFEFKIPQQDAEFLTERVKKAGVLLLAA